MGRCSDRYLRGSFETCFVIQPTTKVPWDLGCSAVRIECSNADRIRLFWRRFGVAYCLRFHNRCRDNLSDEIEKGRQVSAFLSFIQRNAVKRFNVGDARRAASPTARVTDSKAREQVLGLHLHLTHGQKFEGHREAPDNSRRRILHCRRQRIKVVGY